MNITVEVSDVTLASVLREGDDDGYNPRETLGDLVADRVLKALTSEQRKEIQFRVDAIRGEVIRELVTPIVEECLAAPFRKTNAYGEPAGQEVTLRALVVEEAQKMLTARGDYGRGETFVEKIIRTEIAGALTKELAGVILAERERVVGAVKEHAATLIGDAVRKGLAR